MYSQCLTKEKSMIKKLTKHGNSLALIIDRPILELLKINENTELEISTEDGKTLKISPVTTEKRKKKLSSALKKVNKNYGKALKKMS